MTTSKNKKKPNKRRMARTYAMQALYQWQFTEKEPDVLIEEFLFEEGIRSEAVDIAYFQTLLSGALNQIDAIDGLMIPHLDRDISRLNPVELAVLRLSVFELAHCPEVPYAVVINEAIELAKEYGSSDGHKFVNGVLNAMAPGLREAECSK